MFQALQQGLFFILRESFRCFCILDILRGKKQLKHAPSSNSFVKPRSTQFRTIIEERQGTGTPSAVTEVSRHHPCLEKSMADRTQLDQNVIYNYF